MHILLGIIYDTISQETRGPLVPAFRDFDFAGKRAGYRTIFYSQKSETKNLIGLYFVELACNGCSPLVLNVLHTKTKREECSLFHTRNYFESMVLRLK